MAGDRSKDESTGESSDVPDTEKKDSGTTTKKKRGGILSRIWNGLFRIRGDDFEKRLEHISKEEAAVLARMRKRTLSWRRMTRRLIIFSVIFEVIAVGYAIMTTRSLDLNWKMRAARVLPMFLLPALSSLTYSAFRSFTQMCDRNDQKAVERLRAERKSKIDELKEKTNYYITQQLIQRYDPDPAAKAAAATVLASKLGADSGLKMYLGDESNVNATARKSNDVELKQASGLKNRKQLHTRSTGTGSTAIHHPDDQTFHHWGDEVPEASDQLVVGHHHQPGSAMHDGGWMARIAALLVGEDPTQSYALICGNCYRHNGLARKEDFLYVTYYCPHCNALNQSKQLAHISGSVAPNTSFLTSVGDVDVANNASDVMSDKSPASSSPVAAAVETTGESKKVVSGDPVS